MDCSHKEEHMKFDQKEDQYKFSILIAWFVFWISAATTDNLALAAILTLMFLLISPALHGKLLKKLNG